MEFVKEDAVDDDTTILDEWHCTINIQNSAFRYGKWELFLKRACMGLKI